jgi:hypothetical protein
MTGVPRQSEEKKLLMDDKLPMAIQAARECFWGDYRFSPEEILGRLEQDDPAFNQFLFSKIIENSRFPSRLLLGLFQKNALAPMLDRYMAMSRGKERVRLTAANITGKYDLVPERQWQV